MESETHEYEVRVVAEFYVTVESEDEDQAYTDASDLVTEALSPWDMPDNNIIQVDRPVRSF